MGAETQFLRVAVGDLPQAPVGWSFVCKEAELARGPVGITYLDRGLVVFRGASGGVGILDRSCQHLRADLSQGRVVGECLECPYHRWRFATDGRCVEIPQTASVPAFARQRSYPAQVRNGLVFMWNGSRALYPLPFYPGLDPDAYICSGPLTFNLGCPWYMVGANGFDFQHLRTIHERELLEPPQVWNEGHFALASRTVTKIGRNSWYDRLVRFTAGSKAQMTAVNWSGSLVLVTVELERVTTYGMVSLRPVENQGILAQIFAFLPRSRSALGRWAFDLLRTTMRRYLIGRFLKDDATLLNGIRSGPLNLIEADLELARYFQWLSRTANGIPASVPSSRPLEPDSRQSPPH
jgi:phenylpropionate dioxygenase-like ring-hydroxylating dioxygenase large terminal subunit